jgi:hypothetical protein
VITLIGSSTREVLVEELSSIRGRRVLDQRERNLNSREGGVVFLRFQG